MCLFKCISILTCFLSPWSIYTGKKFPAGRGAKDNGGRSFVGRGGLWTPIYLRAGMIVGNFQEYP